MKTATLATQPTGERGAANRFLALDGLRGLAAGAVVVYHFFYRYDQIYGHDNLPVTWISWGHYGVQAFFMISGFVVFWSLDRIQAPFDFVAGRFARLFPLYWASVVTTFVVVALFGLPGREVSLIDGLLNLLMIHGYLGVPNVDGVYWTLVVELGFYGLLFIGLVSRTTARIELLLLPIVALGLVTNLGLVATPGVLNVALQLAYIHFFAAGVCYFRVWQKRATKATYCLIGLSLVATFAGLSFWDSMILGSFHVLFVMVVSGRLTSLGSRPVVYLGRISYALYLIHQNVGFVIIRSVKQAGWSSLVGVIVASIVVLGLAELLTRFVERPAAELVKTLYLRSKRVRSLQSS